MKCFNNFVQSAVNLNREGDRDSNSSGVVEMKILASTSYGYQIKDRSRHKVTKCLSDKKTHGIISYKMFKHLCHTNDQL